MGILILVAQGGRGRGSTNEYAFDLEKLSQMPSFLSSIDDDERAKVAAVTSAGRSPASQSKSDEIDASATQDDAALGDQGDHLSDTVKVITDDSLGDHGDHQTCYEPINPQTPSQEGASDFVQFDQFETVWPWYGDENRETARKAFDRLDQTQRQGAIDYVQDYLAAVKAGKTRRKERYRATQYLESSMWLNRKIGVSKYLSAFVADNSPVWSKVVEKWKDQKKRLKFPASLRTQHQLPNKAIANGWHFPVGWLREISPEGENVDWFPVERKMDGGFDAG